MAITKPTLTKSEEIIYGYFCDNLSVEMISQKTKIPYMTVMDIRSRILDKGYELPKINLKEEQFR